MSDASVRDVPCWSCSVNAGTRWPTCGPSVCGSGCSARGLICGSPAPIAALDAKATAAAAKSARSIRVRIICRKSVSSIAHGAQARRLHDPTARRDARRFPIPDAWPLRPKFIVSFGGSPTDSLGARECHPTASISPTSQDGLVSSICSREASNRRKATVEPPVNTVRR